MDAEELKHIMMASPITDLTELRLDKDKPPAVPRYPLATPPSPVRVQRFLPAEIPAGNWSCKC